MPVEFWITIALITLVAFKLINAYYWKNVRDEHADRVRKWKESRSEQLS